MTTATADPGAGLRTEFAFELPVGYEDAGGRIHRTGTMRLARARDEIAPLRDPRVRDNEAYLTVLLLSRVVTKLGSLEGINPGVVEGMFATDLSFLQDHYRRINTEGTPRAAVACPSCEHGFEVELSGSRPGES